MSTDSHARDDQEAENDNKDVRLGPAERKTDPADGPSRLEFTGITAAETSGSRLPVSSGLIHYAWSRASTSEQRIRCNCLAPSASIRRWRSARRSCC